jgi:hypothetical protein
VPGWLGPSALKGTLRKAPTFTSRIVRKISLSHSSIDGSSRESYSFQMTRYETLIHQPSRSLRAIVQIVAPKTYICLLKLFTTN